MKKLILLSLPVYFLLALTACGDSAIDAVKSANPHELNFNFSQIFDNGPICKKTNWSSSSDEYKRKIVTMSCDFSIPKSALDEVKNKKIASINNSTEKNLSTFETYQKNLEEKINKFEAAIVEVNSAYDHNRLIKIKEINLTEESVKELSNDDFYKSDMHKSHLKKIEGLEKEIAKHEEKKLEYLSLNPRDYASTGLTYGQLIAHKEYDIKRAQGKIEDENKINENNKLNYNDKIHMLKNSSDTVNPDIRDKWYNQSHRQYYKAIFFDQQLKKLISTIEYNNSIANEYIKGNTLFNEININKIIGFFSKEIRGKIQIDFIVNDEFVEIQDIYLRLLNKKIVGNELDNNIYNLLVSPSSDYTIKSWNAFTANLSSNELKLEDFNFTCDAQSGRCNKIN